MLDLTDLYDFKFDLGYTVAEMLELAFRFIVSKNLFQEFMIFAYEEIPE